MSDNLIVNVDAPIAPLVPRLLAHLAAAVAKIRGTLELTRENGWRLPSVHQHGYRLERVAVAAAQQCISKTGYAALPGY
jgi:hypothetical protein